MVLELEIEEKICMRYPRRAFKEDGILDGFSFKLGHRRVNLLFSVGPLSTINKSMISDWFTGGYVKFKTRRFVYKSTVFYLNLQGTRTTELMVVMLTFWISLQTGQRRLELVAIALSSRQETCLPERLPV